MNAILSIKVVTETAAFNLRGHSAIIISAARPIIIKKKLFLRRKCTIKTRKNDLATAEMKINT